MWLEVAEAYIENIRNIEGNTAKLLRIETFLCSKSNLICGREELKRQLKVNRLARLFPRGVSLTFASGAFKNTTSMGVTCMTFTSGAFTTTASEGCHPFDLFVRYIYNYSFRGCHPFDLSFRSIITATSEGGH